PRRRPPASHPLSLHDALPILGDEPVGVFLLHHPIQSLEVALDPAGAQPARQRPSDLVTEGVAQQRRMARAGPDLGADQRLDVGRDRKSTRLNSSHEWISYAVF